MTLTDRKGNIRGREFPTDTGIDGNAYEETTKDQRWVGLCRQIPDTDTRPTSLSFSLSLSHTLSLSVFLSLSLLLLLSLIHYLSSSLRTTRLTSECPSIRPYDPLDRTHAPQHSLPQLAARRFAIRRNFHDGNPFRRRSPWKRPQRRTARHDLSHSRPVVL